MSSGDSAADVTQSEATGAAVEPQRTVQCTRGFSGPASGVAGDRGDDLAGAAPSEAQRSDLQAGQFVKRASFTRSVKGPKPAIPGQGNGPRSSFPPATPA